MDIQKLLTAEAENKQTAKVPNGKRFRVFAWSLGAGLFVFTLSTAVLILSAVYNWTFDLTIMWSTATGLISYAGGLYQQEGG